MIASTEIRGRGACRILCNSCTRKDTPGARANIRAMPKPPPHLKVQRAKAFVDDAGVKVLAKCEGCGREKYIVEGQKVCEECRARPKRKRKRVG
jgi:hypothetical protein